MANRTEPLLVPGPRHLNPPPPQGNHTRANIYEHTELGRGGTSWSWCWSKKEPTAYARL
ncbi:uncharacterized protein BDZ83DRAFT_616813 [Colletotrichum acutatum]|uniref:Uncharacterized protein n=1 Tax=Glomerella acutata TaxID=27357 RepID=A0AAD8XJC6_GLOAC|nr:uncharacterized protein BDZ83DRAFT_616813 [Colletotrichum acutatum]KAK1726225.1 hypothetical protein BDZ83DRAFT_616813 [Colletotrichum acutatum]